MVQSSGPSRNGPIVWSQQEWSNRLVLAAMVQSPFHISQATTISPVIHWRTYKKLSPDQWNFSIFGTSSTGTTFRENSWYRLSVTTLETSQLFVDLNSVWFSLDTPHPRQFSLVSLDTPHPRQFSLVFP